MIPVRVVNLRHEACDVRIDRPGVWGNPFKIGQDGSREEVVARYLESTKGPIWNNFGLLQLLREEIERHAQQHPEAKEVRLGCWCAPLPCHGDVLAKMLQP